MRATVACLAACTLAALFAVAAGADVGTGTTDDGATVSVSSGSGGSGGGSGSGSGGGSGGGAGGGGGGGGSGASTGTTSIVPHIADSFTPPDSAPPVPPSGDAVAEAAAAQLRLPEPAIATAPPRSGLQLAGVRVWFWATNAQARSATATIPGLSATVTARARSLTIGLDGSAGPSCAGGGTPHPDRSAPCTHVFQRRGRHAIEATVRWSLEWTASDGTSGTLPDVARQASFDLVVSDGQAVTD